MTIYSDLLDGIIIRTKRPDLVELSKRAIRSCTLKYHRRHKFFKDLTTLPVANPTPSQGVVMFDIAATFPRWRQFARITLSDSDIPFNVKTMDELLDPDGYAQTHIYLVAGTSLNVKEIAGFPSLVVSYWQDPVATEAGYDSWVAVEYPDLIEAGAAAVVLAGDNESEIYKAAKQEEAEQWASLVSSNLEAQGR